MLTCSNPWNEAESPNLINLSIKPAVSVYCGFRILSHNSVGTFCYTQFLSTFVINEPVKSDFVNVQIFVIVLDCPGVTVLCHLFLIKMSFSSTKFTWSFVLCHFLCLLCHGRGCVHMCQLPAEPRREHWIPSSWSWVTQALCKRSSESSLQPRMFLGNVLMEL